MSPYYDTRQQSDGLWYIVGSMDGENWYYLYEELFSFPSQPEARAWLIAEGYTNREIGNRIQKAVAGRTESAVPDLWHNRNVAYYQLNEESGTIAHDLSGHGHDADLRSERQP